MDPVPVVALYGGTLEQWHGGKRIAVREFGASGVPGILRTAQGDALRSQLENLRAQLTEYGVLRSGERKTLEVEEFEDLTHTREGSRGGPPNPDAQINSALPVVAALGGGDNTGSHLRCAELRPSHLPGLGDPDGHRHRRLHLPLR